jgi:thioredoxin
MLEHLTTETFKEKVFNFELNKEWKYEGELPAIVKFTAAWCSPCKALTPVLLEIESEYNNKINIYEVDVDKEQELSSIFGIRSVPTMLFTPINGQPSMTSGSLPKNKIIDIINDVLL